jgi:lysozyme
MKTSEKGIELIKRFEGCKLTAYKCPAGILTIGYGHTYGVKPLMKFTIDKSERYFDLDINGDGKIEDKNKEDKEDVK